VRQPERLVLHPAVRCDCARIREHVCVSWGLHRPRKQTKAPGKSPRSVASALYPALPFNSRSLPSAQAIKAGRAAIRQLSRQDIGQSRKDPPQKGSFYVLRCAPGDPPKNRGIKRLRTHAHTNTQTRDLIILVGARALHRGFEMLFRIGNTESKLYICDVQTAVENKTTAQQHQA